MIFGIKNFKNDFINIKSILSNLDNINFMKKANNIIRLYNSFKIKFVIFHFF